MKRIVRNGIPFRARLLPEAEPLAEKFINCLMCGGKKSIARRIFAEMLEILKKENSKPLELFSAAIDQASPSIEVRPRRVGGGVYQVPTEVNPNRQRILAIRWILNAARKMKGKPMAECLATVFLETRKGEGPVVKKKEEVHKMAAANKAFAHFGRSN